MSEGTSIGLLVMVIIGVIGAFFGGRQMQKKETIVSRSDILEGAVKRTQTAGNLLIKRKHVNDQAREESERVSKEIKEAPNEEIVRMFVDRFSKPHGTRRHP